MDSHSKVVAGFQCIKYITWKNDSLWYKYHLYLCKNSQLKQKLLLELHTSPVGGHSGFLKTYHRVKKDFWGDGLKIDVQRFVAECLVCQQNKVDSTWEDESFI